MSPYPVGELVLFWSGLISYLTAGATGLAALAARREQIPHFLRLFTSAGVAAHLAFLAAAASRTHACPMFHLFEACVFLAAVAAVVALIVDLRLEVPAITAAASPLAALVAGAPYVSALQTSPAAIQPNAILPFHIALTAVAYAAFLLAFVTGILYLVQERSLKRHLMTPLVSALPALEITNAVNARAVMAGFALLTVGLAFGFARASLLEKPFFTDGRVIGGLITWGCYGGLTAMRLTRRYHGRSAARMSIWSFAVAAFTLFGATLLGSGVHHS
ncbi:MAG: cytochrome c biogenesis protein CcsA [Planctomycetes bacterium]|nr:cytochrome c biogenesis protein CcsA [Planctomycetota bacterium]